MNYFQEYCQLWKLKVNVGKTKIMVFSKGRLPRNLNFYYDNLELEIVKDFTYLGVIFSRSGSSVRTKKSLAQKATKAMFDVLKKGRLHNLSIKCQLDLFDKMVLPFLLYGSEVWGYGNYEILERVHLKFCKLLLRIKSSTLNFMVYGELGRYPLDIIINTRIITFWAKLLQEGENKFHSLYTNCHGRCIQLTTLNVNG